MQVETSRFGNLDIDADGLLLFTEGIVGFEAHRHWVLLRVADETVGWLQSLHQPETALPVVTPLDFVPDYKLRFRPEELRHLPWSPADDSLVLAVVSRHAHSLTANLRAPILINLNRGLGRQVITCDNQPLQYALTSPSVLFRKSA